MKRLLQIVTLIISIIFWQWIALSLNSSPLLHVNALVLSVLICFIIFGWPKDSWLGSDNAQTCKSKHGASAIGVNVKSTDPVQSLANQKNVDSYYLSSFGESQARSTAVDVNSALIGRFIIYLFVAAVVGLYGGQKEITPFEFVTSAIAIFAPVLWDLSRCDKIRNLNKKIS